MSEYQHTSVCIVEYHDWNEGKMLKRVADLNENQTSMKAARINEDMPKTFDNRDLLYGGRDNVGPSEEGVLGVWSWSATQRDTDETKDFIDTKYEADKIPIQVISYNVPSPDALVDYLKSGLNVKSRSTRVLLYYHSDRGNYYCVLCNETNCNITSEKITLKPETNYIQLFPIKVQNILNVDSYLASISLYRYFTISESGEKLYTKSKDDIVRDVIKRKFSWSKAKGVVDSKRAWQAAKAFIDSSSDDIVDEISTLCSCSKEDAKQLLNNFIMSSDRSLQDTFLDYLSEEDIIRLMEKNPAVQEKFQEEYDKWNDQLKKEIAEKEEELEILEDELEKEKLSEQGLKEATKDLEIKKAELEEQITRDQETIDKAVEVLRNRILSVQNDAVAVMDEYPLFRGLFLTDQVSSMETDHVKKEESRKSQTAFSLGESFEKYEDVYDWRNQIELLDDSLESAGVDRKLSRTLSYFLYLAHVYQIPILLAGPAGDAIANAVSAALYGRLSARLNCDSEYSLADITNARKVTNTTIAIRSPFKAAWSDSILSLIQRKSSSKDYYLLVPFAEDLCIQPNGILNYCVPVLTELFVCNSPNGNIAPGGMRDDFTAYNKSKKIKNLLPDSIHILSLAASNIRPLLSEMENVGKSIPDTDCLYLFGIVPYLYVLNRKEDALDMVHKEAKLGKDIKKLLLDFLGDCDG